MKNGAELWCAKCKQKMYIFWYEIILFPSLSHSFIWIASFRRKIEMVRGNWIMKNVHEWCQLHVHGQRSIHRCQSHRNGEIQRFFDHIECILLRFWCQRERERKKYKREKKGETQIDKNVDKKTVWCVLCMWERWNTLDRFHRCKVRKSTERKVVWARKGMSERVIARLPHCIWNVCMQYERMWTIFYIWFVLFHSIRSFNRKW